MFQAGADWGAQHGGALGAIALNVSAAANAASEAWGSNALGSAVADRNVIGGAVALAGMLPIGKLGKIAEGAHLPINQALDEAAHFLGAGYKEAKAGRFVSADGLRQVRMGVGDITGTHAGGPHMNFETKVPIAGRPGRFTLEKMHIYLDGQ